MVRLEEVEDETFVEKPESSKYDELLVDDDADYTDTDSEISDDDGTDAALDESLAERISALRDIVPPQTRAKISNITSSALSAASSTINFGGKGLWVLCTSVLLLGLPYSLAFMDEQMVQEEERQRQMMAEGTTGFMNSGDQSQAKAAL